MKRKKDKKWIALLMLTVFVFLLGGFNSVMAVTKIRVSICNTMIHPQGVGMSVFKKIVEKETNGELKVQIYPSSVLGGERESIEQVQRKSIEMATASAGPLTLFNKKMYVMDIPFAFDNYYVAWMVMDSPIAEELWKSFEKEAGLKVLGLMENGFRQVTNRIRPIYTPDDLKGIKLRVMEAPMHIANFRYLGANPTPVPWPELYMTLQQKIVDGQENPITNIWETKMYEVQKYVSLTKHIYDAMPLCANLEWFNSLPPEYQTILERAGSVATNVSRFVNAAREKSLIPMLEAKGLKINVLTDAQIDLFRQKSQAKVIELIKKETGDPDFVDKWIKAIDEAREYVKCGLR